MSWSTPRTYTNGELVTDVMLNATRDQLLETGPAKVTTAGDLLVATGANALARLGKGADNTILGVVAGAVVWTTRGGPACRVYRTTDQSIATATTTAIAFDAERHDATGMHEPATNPSRITIVTPGVYRLSAAVEFGTDPVGSYSLVLLVNGTTTIATDQKELTSGTGPAAMLNASTEYKLAAADYVEAVVTQDSGVSVAVKALGNYSPEFAAAWLGPG